MLAVINNNIRPPITIQNGRNKQTFDTYAITINLVSLVLEETCFAGHTFEYKWKTKQNTQSRKCNADPTSKNYRNTVSFNKMIETQLAQIAATIPISDSGKILG